MRRYVVAPVVLLLGALGCNTAPEAASWDSGVPPDAPLATLTPDEVDRVCNAIGAQHLAIMMTPAYLDGFCRYQALLSAQVEGKMNGLTPDEVVAKCETTYRQLRGAIGKGAGSGDTGTCTLSGCATATVADYEGCIIGMDQSWLELFSQLPPCSALRDGDPFDTLEMPAPPAACDPLMSCAALPSSP